MKVRIFFILFSFFLWSVTSITMPIAIAEDGHNHAAHSDHQENDKKVTQKKNSHDGHDHDEDDHGKEGNSHKDHGDHRKVSDSHEGHDEHNEKSGSHDGHDDHGDEGVISLDGESRSMIQLKTEKVLKRNLGGRLKVYGKIAKDTENYSYVTFDGDGIVKSIDVDLGSIVSEGEDLLTVRKTDGILETIKSEIHGAVLSIFIRQGDRVDSLTSLLSIIDVDTLRATIDIYERDLRLVEVGQKVVLTTEAFPNKTFKGKVVYISPQVDEHTQAIKARVDVDNSNHLLRLGMFVSGDLIYASDQKVVTVPLSAVQQLNGKDIVFVAEEENNLKLREVKLGRSVNDYVEVIKGVSEGEVVVAQGSFYLKSEQAKEAFGDGHNH